MSTSKTARRCAIAVAALALTLAVPQSAYAAGGNVSIDWSMPKTPASGLTNITFPLTVNSGTAHDSGLYFAQEFEFGTSKKIGYTGLQPRPDSGGHERLHGVFSYFGAGSSSTDPNCRTGADGGSGVSCSVEFDAVYGHAYALKVARTGTNTWTGTATDTVTQTSHHIGTYTVPADSGNLEGWYAGFVEYYLGVPSCSQLLRTDVVFGGPTSTDGGGLIGTSKADKEYADCIGQAGYQSTQVGNGVHITRGYKATRPSQNSTAASSAAAPTEAVAAQAPATPKSESVASATSAPAADSSALTAADQPDAPSSVPSNTAGTGTSTANPALASTGSSSVLPVTAGGAAALVAGGAVLWAVRRGKGLRRATHR